jgi:O-succinylhomoserine sulfhydrylase
VAKKQMSLGEILLLSKLKAESRRKKVLDNIKMCSLSANLGDTRTIVTHPSSTTHGRLSEEDRLELEYRWF